MSFFLENWNFVVKGLLMTLQLALVVLLFTTLVSVVFGVLATLPQRWLGWLIHGYVELFRSIPLIVNVFFIFFGAPLLGLDLSPFAAVTTGLTLWGSANGIEIVRGGLQAVSRHQWKSAWALGLPRWRIYLHIVGPQSLKAILPAYTGLLTLLVQATSLGALVGVGEFLKTGQTLIERTTMMTGASPAFTVYGTVLLVYFIICSLLSWLSRYLERRLGRPLTRNPS
ncbi:MULTISPECIES: amino acid ABC transporter permease [Pseudomonas]|uniref:amino acid ABC transporter permease n=1 Tax=Pseudomonas TaxID=286 RepID=UPI00023A17EA|nr:MULTISPECIES: amino acid ABC transporter permease [Pseudomonas]HCV75769.1 amino acid ABC transporter permease [Pseudomonas sp.]EHK69407.1 putative amino acid ABC transporter permease [Pseudomonas psychrotolerans L19]MBA1181977.1 amino acid ABC transporter permease [Pseudomonas psychrotolerans]MBA1213651.1 amino acid ABC transporter permease [Pseudomonas psychrotolerans]QEU02870.1 amino acid ABC transporter permease [Pseudomonas oryzihabitans]